MFLRSKIDKAARTHLLAIGAIWLIIGLCFANSLNNDFHFDDEHSLIGNPHIRGLDKAAQFFVDPQLFSRNEGSGMYRPLVLLSYALNFIVAGYDKTVFHVTNLIIHAVVASLLYALLVNFSGSKRHSAFVTVAFAIHPLSSEPVNYVSSRSESMMALFALSSILFFALRERIAGTMPLSVLTFACALMSKSSAIVIPLWLALYEWRLGRPIKKTAMSLWPFLVITLFYVVKMRLLIREALWDKPVRDLTAHLYTQAKAVVYYLKILIFPYPQSVEHAFVESANWYEPALITSALLVGTGALILWRGRNWKKRIPVFWLLVATLSLMPTIVIPLNMLVNERRVYFTLIAISGFSVLIYKTIGRKKIRILIFVVVVCFFSITYQRNKIWVDELTLWRDASRHSPSAIRPQVRLGILYRQIGHLDSSEHFLRKALAINSKNAPALNTLGNVYSQRGDWDSAEIYYKSALEILPSYPDAINNLASLYSSKGNFAMAEELYRRALSLSPLRGELWNNLGTLLMKAGRFEDAKYCLFKATKLNPSEAPVLFNLGGTFEGVGEVEEAIAAYKGAITLDSTYAKPYYNLGLLMLKMEERKKARQAFENFLRFWSGDSTTSSAVQRLLDNNFDTSN